MPGKKGFKYVYSVGHIDNVLKKIRDTGRPDKLTLAYLRNTWLLRNAQYSAVLDILKDMQFIDSSGVPADLYAEYQNPTKESSALANGIKNAYPQLFKAYPNACDLDKKTLDGYLKQQTGAEKSVLGKISSTFKRLCSLSANGGTASVELPSKEEKPLKKDAPDLSDTLIPISMNIQIVIPSDASEEQYDKIFSSLKKFLSK